MGRKELLLRLITTFALTLVVAVVVTYLWSLIWQGTGTVDWLTSFRLAFILAVALPLLSALRRKKK